jgi:hypothetical protein
VAAWPLLNQSFGARLSAAAPAQRYVLHAAEGDRDAFADYDRVVAGLFDRAIRGEEILELKPAMRRTENDVVALKISAGEREVLSRVLAPEAQRARGAWYIPSAGGALAGMIEFAYWVGAEPRFAISAADLRCASMKLDTPDAILVWAALEPVMELVYLPLKLRSGYWVGDRRPEQMDKDWATVDATYAALGIDTAPLSTFKDGRGWATLGIEEVIATRRALIEAWESAPHDVGGRALVLLISCLVERYYARAKDGMAQRTKVINKTLERALSGAFGGDWLAFIRYLGEPVHPAEQIAMAVESTSLIVSDPDRVEQVAATTGVPEGEVKRMIAVYWAARPTRPWSAAYR